ncbi:TerB family tellurite resistance protein [Polaribacter batillariae]|uniref:TerB family tellurite resistance protein n=1 Tax=Polaribacter batillariae TaxID=2808900 RepID=A0ABX7SUE8_9FLAO|nr:TerB family tellurite resistance protein [Polaribacter batillariae]QTD36463.1 TerB family tellurite resistance protein [Polaribacter batillariae]
MSISDLYFNGEHKKEIGHFANIVKIAKADGKISEEEKALLIKTGKRLNISLEEFTAIINNPEKFPINPPISYDERIERLYRLTKMVLVDGEAALKEVKLLRKIAVGLHFSIDNAEKVCDEAIHLVMNDNNLEDFTSAIKKINLV